MKLARRPVADPFIGDSDQGIQFLSGVELGRLKLVLRFSEPQLRLSRSLQELIRALTMLQQDADLVGLAPDYANQLFEIFLNSVDARIAVAFRHLFSCRSPAVVPIGRFPDESILTWSADFLRRASGFAANLPGAIERR
jgi:hypothetical protein